MNTKLQKSARDLGKKLFPLVVKNDVEGIAELYASEAQLKAWFGSDVFDWKRLERETGMTSEELLKRYKRPGIYKLMANARRENGKRTFARVVEESKKVGVDLSKVEYVDTEIAELYMREDEGFSLAADVNLLIKSAGKTYIIQLDDCIIGKKGWLLGEGFRWLTAEEK